uniref:Uncharacterized protein n=1 Tax=Lactuca sativa TaxID=4236 RepID=A0A9R1WWP0_LACSA|nr:hypothetical protein LSAT_V11C800400350 [Lactuca sativa]
MMSIMGNPTNTFFHESTIGKTERQNLINHQGCVVWITCLSGYGKSTLACVGLVSKSITIFWYVLDPMVHGPFGLPSPKQLDRMNYGERGLIMIY